MPSDRPRAIECVPPPPKQAVRARYLRRTDLARSRSAARFDAACRLAGVSNVQVADGWGVSEVIVRRVRAGEAPLGDRIEGCPPSVRRAYHQAALDELDAAVPPSRMPLGTHVHLVNAKSGEVADRYVSASADGVVDPDESGDIAKRAYELEQRAHVLVLEARRGR